MSQYSWICKQSGNKCYRLSARELQIAWKDDSRYWKWISLPESRFSEVAVLRTVCWLDILGILQSKMLSPNTIYASYLVFKLTKEHEGLSCSTTASIRLVEKGVPEIHVDNSIVYITPRENATDGRVPWTRSDGWMEIKIGTFFTGEIYSKADIYMRLSEVKGGQWKKGLIVEGIEVRPMVKPMYESMIISQQVKHQLKQEKVEKELNSVRLQLDARQVTITTLKTEKEEHRLKHEKSERELNSARPKITAHQVTIKTLKTEVNRLRKIVIVSFTGLVFWLFLMKMLPNIWSFCILVTMLGIKMINKVVSDAFEGWVLNISIYICSYLISKICWS